MRPTARRTGGRSETSTPKARFGQFEVKWGGGGGGLWLRSGQGPDPQRSPRSAQAFVVTTVAWDPKGSHQAGRGAGPLDCPSPPRPTPRSWLPFRKARPVGPAARLPASHTLRPGTHAGGAWGSPGLRAPGCRPSSFPESARSCRRGPRSVVLSSGQSLTVCQCNSSERVGKSLKASRGKAGDRTWHQRDRGSCQHLQSARPSESFQIRILNPDFRKGLSAVDRGDCICILEKEIRMHGMEPSRRPEDQRGTPATKHGLR